MRKLKTEELERPDVDVFQQMPKMPVILVADNIRSRTNVGALFRTADAFVVDKIILGGISPRPPHRDIRRTALGATESVAWEYQSNLINALKKLKSEGVMLLGLEQCDESLSLQQFQTKANEHYALVVGNEVEGIQDEIVDLLDVALEIPQSGVKHSLNVGAAAAVGMWHFYQQLMIKK